MMLQEYVVEHAIWIISLPLTATRDLLPQSVKDGIRDSLRRLCRQTICKAKPDVTDSTIAAVDSIGNTSADGEPNPEESIRKGLADAFYPDQGITMLRDVPEKDASLRKTGAAITSTGIVLLAFPEPFLSTSIGAALTGTGAACLLYSSIGQRPVVIKQQQLADALRRQVIHFDSNIFHTMAAQVTDATTDLVLEGPATLIIYVLWRLHVFTTAASEKDKALPVLERSEHRKPPAILYDYCLKAGFINNNGEPLESEKKRAMSTLNFGWRRAYSYNPRKKGEEQADEDVYNAVMRVCALEALKRTMQKLPIIAVVGKQNAGKSTLISKLTGAAVPDIAFDKHTADEGLYLLDGNQLILDTPGLGTVDKYVAALQQRIQLCAEAGMFKAVIAIAPLQEGVTREMVDFLNNLEQGVHVLLCLSHAGRLDEDEVTAAINDRWDSAIKDTINHDNIRFVALESNKPIFHPEVWNPEQVKTWIMGLMPFD